MKSSQGLVYLFTGIVDSSSEIFLRGWIQTGAGVLSRYDRHPAVETEKQTENN